MRNNLVFDGIPEDKGETDPSCYEKIWDILAALPNINVNEIYIAKCHRLGHFQKGFSRGIISNFHWYGDLTEIMNKRQYLLPSIYGKYDHLEEWENHEAITSNIQIGKI